MSNIYIYVYMLVPNKQFVEWQKKVFKLFKQYKLAINLGKANIFLIR